MSDPTPPQSGSPGDSPKSLKRQLEIARFERAKSVIESLAEHRALLTTMELARVNDILTGVGHAPGGKSLEPWREEPMTVTLPSGQTHTFALLRDPKLSTREILHNSTELSEEGGNPLDAAIDAYAGLVLLHAFKDANRRTAVLAAHYFLQRYGVPLSGLAIHEIGLGDLREEGTLQSLRETVHQMVKFTSRGGRGKT
jgi:hypothetical protein